MQNPNTSGMNAVEGRAAAGLSLVFAFRMLGMFMVLPVLATYGQDLGGSTPALIGVAIGIYGLTQAVLQIPFGMLSDRIGRLPVIYFGLLIFALGAGVAAVADSIWGVIAGRTLQGAGAISAAVMALLSDLTREQHRTKAMATMGMSIGVSFAVAMVVGPLLTKSFGLSGLFWITAVMALLGMLVVKLVVPQGANPLLHRESGVVPGAIRATLLNKDLLRLDFAIFALHAVLMASFIALPLALENQAQLARDQHWWVYLSALLIGFFAMVPFIIYGEKKRQMRRVLSGSVLVLLACELYFWWCGAGLYSWVFGIIVFFTAFNLLEASLPSLVSKVSPAGAKGTAMGVYSTSQFLGAAVGGMAGGVLYQHYGLEGVFVGCAVLLILWAVIAVTMNEPPYVTSLRLPLTAQTLAVNDLVERVKALAGVSDAMIVAEEAALYIKVDTQQLDRALLEQMLEEAAETQKA